MRYSIEIKTHGSPDEWVDTGFETDHYHLATGECDTRVRGLALAARVVDNVDNRELYVIVRKRSVIDDKFIAASPTVALFEGPSEVPRGFHGGDVDRFQPYLGGTFSGRTDKEA